MATKLRPVDLAWLVNFVNEYAVEPRRVAGEQDEPYPPLDTLGDLNDYHLALASSLSRAQLVALANRLYEVFGASYGRAGEVLNGLLRDSGPSPRVSARADTDDDSYEVSWVVENEADAEATSSATDIDMAPLTLLMGACALALLDVLTGPQLFGVCNAARCVDVFVDRSPGGQRRYCSSSCQNRAKVAAFRDRQSRRSG